MASELRWHPLAGRWVVIAEDREHRPFEFSQRPPRPRREHIDPSCPFCPGNELETLPAVHEVAVRGGGWHIRVIPNKFPSFAGEGEPVGDTGRVGERAVSYGVSEVVVVTERHDLDLGDLAIARVAEILGVLAERRSAHARHRAVRHTSMLVNCGPESGASVRHAHAQVLSTPFVPPAVQTEVAGQRQLGDLVEAAFGGAGELLVGERTHVVAGCPAWSMSPYEVWVVPRRRVPALDLERPDELADVASLLVDVLGRLRRVVGDVDHNIMVQNAPHDETDRFRWYLRILPRVVAVAGFELSSGTPVNAVTPERAADRLRSASLPSGAPAGRNP